MRIDIDTCPGPDLLAAEVRRLQGVIAALANKDATMVDSVAYAVWHESEEAPGRIAYASPIKGLRGTGETRDGEEFIALYGKPTLTYAERAAVERAIRTLDEFQKRGGWHSAVDEDAATLWGLLGRMA